jgi:hypothetical protein
MLNIDFTTTSCCRYDLLSRTYNSFVSNFAGINFKQSTLFLNLDHYEGFGDVEKSIEVAKSFFGNVVHNVSEQPNFAKAVKWCWSNDFNTDFVFHLEEDWQLLKPVEIDDLINVFKKNDSDVVSVRLRSRGRLREGVDNAIILAPSLFKKDFLQIHKYMNDNKNPEKSIHDIDFCARRQISKEMRIKKSYSYVFTNANMKKNDKSSSLVEDIGREWRNEKKCSLQKRGVIWRFEGC